MKIKQCTVNDIGLGEIRGFLSCNHKLGGEHLSLDMLRGWAQAAEYQLGEGNPASVEIRSFDSISGRPEAYTISGEGLDCVEIEIED